MALPALDLPVSRTGLLVYHPPLFKVTPESGSFRFAPYEAPVSAALAPRRETGRVAKGIIAGVAGGTRSATSGEAAATDAFQPLPPPPPPVLSDADGKDDGKQKPSQSAREALLDKFKADSLAGKRAGILPISVSFPAFGPSVYLVSELTGENQAPTAVLVYQRDKKAGGK